MSLSELTEKWIICPICGNRPTFKNKHWNVIVLREKPEIREYTENKFGFLKRTYKTILKPSQYKLICPFCNSEWLFEGNGRTFTSISILKEGDIDLGFQYPSERKDLKFWRDKAQIARIKYLENLRVARVKQREIKRKKESENLRRKIAEQRKTRRKFLADKRKKGLVKYINHKGHEMWGTKEEVKKWKLAELGVNANFQNYTPREFEVFVGELLTVMGFSVEIKKYQQDFGIDIIATRDNERIVVEVKRWNTGNLVGNDIVRSVLGAMWKAKANKAIIVTTSDFSVLAREQAKEAPVELWDLGVLKELIDKYYIHMSNQT